MSRQGYFKAAALASVLALGAASAYANPSGGGSSGGGGGGGSSGSSSGGASLVCGEGRVPDASGQMCVPCGDGTIYDSASKTCVNRSSSLIDDYDLYVQGRELALDGHYQDALDLFATVSDRNDADVLTMIGYATRKLGRTEEGIAIYHQALAIDPDNLNTHEYLGEGYLASGRIDLAEAQLDTLERLCGSKQCEQYQDLEKALLGEPVWN